MSNDNGDNNHKTSYRNSALDTLERRLTSEVDADLFNDPKNFRTLHRVIDILGAQLLDEDPSSSAKISSSSDPDGNGGNGERKVSLSHEEVIKQLNMKNPAYRALQQQQAIVEGAIEHLAVTHCSDLNGSVANVGFVARQFSDAVYRVRNLRKQVKDIKHQLHYSNVKQSSHHHDGGNPNEAGAGGGTTTLRELWLKKLECEAVLTLLSKLEIIREAPTAFDSLVMPPYGGPCRIGAAVTLLSTAITLMFSDDIAGIQALTKIMDQLMTRKQKAEEIVWDTLHDIIYLRTGNNVNPTLNPNGSVLMQLFPKEFQNYTGPGSTPHNPSTSHGGKTTTTQQASYQHGKKDVSAVPGGNLFASILSSQQQQQQRLPNNHSLMKPSQEELDDDFLANFDFDFDDDDESAASTFSGFSNPSMNENSSKNSNSQKSNNNNNNNNNTATSHNSYKPTVMGRLIPHIVMETELDLEEDELLCLEGDPLDIIEQRPQPGRRMMPQNNSNQRPVYSDATQALRILVETIAKLGRLDDVERFLNESLERELRSVAEREQQKTLALLERRKHKRLRNQQYMRDTAATTLPFEFKHHLMSLLYSFGNVMLRLSHLAQILRARITDPTINTPSYSPPSSALQGVLKAAYNIMQREIKTYLCACLAITDENSPVNPKQNQQPGLYDQTSQNVSSIERGIFSLGILQEETEPSHNTTQSSLSSSSSWNIPANQFVINVLVPMTHALPQLRYALQFRRRLERWTRDNEDLKKELALSTAEDTSTPSYNVKTGETALDFLDKVIEKEVLPVLQDLAVNCTVSALERDDAFEPRPENIYSKGQSDVGTCVACSALLDATTPLFSALHRLPKGSNMYTPLVAVLDYSLLAFISRVKQRVEDICTGKKATELLDHDGDEKTGISAAVEYRKAYSLLLQEYGERPDVVTSTTALPSASSASGGGDRITPLAPSTTDTRARYSNSTNNSSNGIPNNLEKNEGGSHLDPIQDLEREDDALEKEIPHLLSLLQFGQHNYGEHLVVCNDEEVMQAAYLAHSLLKFAQLLEKRLTNKGGKWAKTTTRALREAVRTIKVHGIRMAKFSRIDMLVQV